MGATILTPQVRSLSRLITLSTKVSAKDLSTIEDKLKAAGLSLSTYLRESALAAQVNPPVQVAAINIEQWDELGRMGSNINQIARQLNTRGVVDPFLLELIEHNRTLLAEVRAALIGGK